MEIVSSSKFTKMNESRQWPVATRTKNSLFRFIREKSFDLASPRHPLRKPKLRLVARLDELKTSATGREKDHAAELQSALLVTIPISHSKVPLSAFVPKR
jgi:hypothetical protein